MTRATCHLSRHCGVIYGDVSYKYGDFIQLIQSGNASSLLTLVVLGMYLVKLYINHYSTSEEEKHATRSVAFGKIVPLNLSRNQDKIGYVFFL